MVIKYNAIRADEMLVGELKHTHNIHFNYAITPIQFIFC